MSYHGVTLGGIPMAESKQYVAQTLDNGSIQISDAVIAEVVAHAVSEVKGVVGINTKSGSDFADFLNKKKWNKGLTITVADNNKVTIDCNIVVCTWNICFRAD